MPSAPEGVPQTVATFSRVAGYVVAVTILVVTLCLTKH